MPSPVPMTKLGHAIKCFGGCMVFYEHLSEYTMTVMKFSIFLPGKGLAETSEDCDYCPVIYWLSGFTCNDKNFVMKSGAYRTASLLNLIVVCPDTSPRECNIEGENDSWDFGTGAGFYVDATEPKWASNYRMFSYVTRELTHLVESNFRVVKDCRSIFGHSMGGHGALIAALTYPGFYKSVSAFAPICNPMKCPWGQKAFTGYLGSDEEKWKQYDACELAKSYKGPKLEIIIDQGLDDNFYHQKQLLPENLVEACANNENIIFTARMHERYDHSYYFISTFIEGHIRYHSKILEEHAELVHEDLKGGYKYWRHFNRKRIYVDYPNWPNPEPLVDPDPTPYNNLRTT